MDKVTRQPYRPRRWPCIRGAIRPFQGGRIAQVVEQLTLNQRVVGSSPTAPTSLRSSSYGSAGRPARTAGSSKNEGGLVAIENEPTFLQTSAIMKYVYILESLEGQHFYVGITDELSARLAKHNAGEVSHTAKYRPWRIKTYIALSNEKQAFELERFEVRFRPGLREEKAVAWLLRLLVLC